MLTRRRALCRAASRAVRRKDVIDEHRGVPSIAVKEVWRASDSRSALRA